MTWIKNNKLVSIILFACSCYLVYYLILAVKWIPYHNQLDFGEGFVTYVNNMFANRDWKWDITKAPYLTLIYGIGYPLANLPFIKLFGMSLESGRIVSFISIIIIAVIVYLLVKSKTNNKVYGIIASLLLFTQPLIRNWTLVTRVQTFAVMLSFVGLYLAYKFKSSNSKWIYLSIIFFIFSLLTKISTVVCISSVCLWLLIDNWKFGLKYIGIFIVSFGVVLGVLQLWSGGQYLNHVLFYNFTDRTIRDFGAIKADLEVAFFPLIALIAISILYLIKKVIRNKENNLLVIVFILSIIINVVLALKPGSYIDYFTECVITSSICTGIMLQEVIRKVQGVKIFEKINATFAINIGLILLLIGIMGCSFSIKNTVPYPDNQYNIDTNTVTQIINDTNKPVITENAGTIINDKKNLYIEMFVFVNLSEKDKWNDANYVNDFYNNKFDYVVLRYPIEKRVNGDGHFPKYVVEAIKDNFSVVYNSKVDFYWYGYTVYENNNKLKNDNRDIVKKILNDEVVRVKN